METGFVPPQPNGGMVSPLPMMPPAMPAPQPPPAANPQAWAKSWKRPEEWTDAFLIEKFNVWDKTDNAHWGAWKDEARVNYDMVAGRQLPEEAKAENEENGLVSVTINKIDATVSAVSGSEMSNQQETKYYPRETSTRGPDGRLQDVVANEILTGAAEWVREETDQGDEESESFRDCLICGLGVTDGKMDYDTDPDGMASVERCDPLEFRIQAGAQRPNAVDARRIAREKAFSKDEAKEKFNVTEGGKSPSWQRNPHDNNPGQAYKHGLGDNEHKDDVWICEYQWWELEKVHKVLNPQTGQLEELTDAEFERLIKVPELASLANEAASYKTRRYYRAFRCGDQILEVTPLPDEEFTYKFITGKFDRNKKVWYGLVRAMVDPQRLLNKQVSQTQRIVDTNAKGGILAESGAFEEPEQAQEDWAASDSVVMMKDGAISQGKVMAKPIAPIPPGVDRLLQIAEASIPATSGVNAEMMGIVDRQQAGVVDVQRKEAAYGVLQAFFRSMKRYRRMRGKHILKLITRYMSDNRLIRIVGRTGNVQYLPLVRDENTRKYDVVVDDAPTGPNQKDKVFQFLVMFGGPLLAKLNLPPQVLLKFLEFSPLPSALIAEIQQEVQKIPAQPNPEEIKAKAEAQKLQAELQQKGVEAQMQQQQMQMDAQVNAQKAQLEVAKLQGENQKLAVENEWVKIEMAKTAMDHRASEQEAQLRARETQMREQNDAAKIAADIEKMKIDADIKRAELEIKRQEIALKQQELLLREKEIAARSEIDVAKIAQADRHSGLKAAGSAPPSVEPEADKDREPGLRELLEMLAAPLEIEVVNGVKRARRVVLPKQAQQANGADR